MALASTVLVDLPIVDGLGDVRDDPVAPAADLVAEQPGFTLDHLPQAVALLWQLGRDDDRPLNQFPDQPIRVLQDLTGYEITKPLIMNRLAFSAMAEIARAPSAFMHGHTPLDVTDALLAREGFSTSWRLHAFALEPFGIDHQKTEALRRGVLELVSELRRRTAL